MKYLRNELAQFKQWILSFVKPRFVKPRFFKPITDLYYISKGDKYRITYTEKGRQIVDDRGKKRIVRPLPSELCR